MRILKMSLLLTASVLFGCGGQSAIDPAPAPADAPESAGGSGTTDSGSGTTEAGSGTTEAGSGTTEAGSGTTEAGSGTTEAGSGTTEAGSGTTEAGSGTTEATERVKAKAGVAKKGRSLDNVEGGIVAPLVTPAKAYFNVREKAVFEIQIPNAMKLYAAVNGGPPKTQDEFMSQIIQANAINLPELNAGQKYVYDPEKGELMVERPAN